MDIIRDVPKEDLPEYWPVQSSMFIDDDVLAGPDGGRPAVVEVAEGVASNVVNAIVVSSVKDKYNTH